MTGKQLIKYLGKNLKPEHLGYDEGEYEGDLEDLSLEELFRELDYPAGHSVTIGDYIISQEEQFGGEGEGEDYWIVFKAQKGEEVTYWKIPGWYSSSQGSEIEIDNTFEVEPREVMVRKWFKKKK